MNTEKAVDLLDNLIGMVDDNQENDYDSALHMAINALKAQSDGDTISRQAAVDAMGKAEWAKERLRALPSAQPEKRTENTRKTHACDLISRKAAIDEIKALYEWHDTVTEDRTIDHLKRLPSAQPDSKELSFTHKALDTISRQDAIRIVDGIDTWQAGWRGDAIESMKALPSAQPEVLACGEGELIAQPEIIHCGVEPRCEACEAFNKTRLLIPQPERKKGKWIILNKGLKVTSYKCSKCGKTVIDDTGYDVSEDYPFCHCGADMREPEDIPMEYFESGGK